MSSKNQADVKKETPCTPSRHTENSIA